uniref:G-protein coupled receptors family 1 profile domain-containing protein n=1 Tax=Nothobranchius furzeri TaxID=105023 RepID=A0A8C6MBL2_NOTFU
MTVLGSGFLLSVIYLCGSTALIPKVLDIFLFDRRYILYEACLSYMFFVYLFKSVQTWTLVTMAYDRFIAICFPLRYHSIVTKRSVVAMLLVSWGFVMSFLATLVGFLTHLSFCIIGFLSSENLYISLGFCCCFFLPYVSTNVAALTSYIHPNARIINASLTHTLPSLINPIIYSLKTEEVMKLETQLPHCKSN